MEYALQMLENKCIIYRNAFARDYVVDIPAMMAEFNKALHGVAVEAEMIQEERELGESMAKPHAWIEYDSVVNHDDLFKIVRAFKNILEGHGVVGVMVDSTEDGVKFELEGNITDIYHVTENLQDAGFGGDWGE